MKSCVLCCVLFSLLIHYYSEVLCFNLEPRIPVIKRGAKGSYFGYSVAEHQSIHEINESIAQDWLLVGAPLGQNLQPGTNRSGALWRCPMTTRQDDCQQVITDGKRNPYGQYNSDKSIYSVDLMRPSEDEIKDGQWMGVTVRSQGPGKKVMVCAHRYMLKGPDFRWGQGLCYTLTQFLDFDQSWEPCKGRALDKAHEQYGFCQAGTSGMLLEDDTMIIGSPGPYTWRGTMYVIDVSDDFMSRDKNKYYGPVEEKTSPVNKYSYLGMSVTAGHFLGPQMTYAAGAPRSNGTGEVVLFSKVGVNANIMNVREVIRGEQFASSFGYEMVTADLNGDKRSDLIVAAPFYFSKEKGGAVYVYINDDDYCLTCNSPIKLEGKPESRFGFALANLGDLNKDGFDDIAIGAPYEDNGVVYIYLGSSKGLTIEAQTIRASELPSLTRPEQGIRTFGYSLSGGIDLDHNGYPDLLVGAYDSDAVVLLRARPIIDIVTNITPDRNLRNIDPNKPGCTKYPNSRFTCFTFDACCSIEPLVVSRVNNLTLIYSIEAETYERKFSRVWFGSDEEKRPHKMERLIVLVPDPNRSGQMLHCQEETVFIKENTRDIQTPIKFRLSYKIEQRQPRQAGPNEALPSIDDFPILNQQEAWKTFQATFLTDCGDDNICECNVKLHAELALPPGARPRSWQLELGLEKEIVLNVTVRNEGESAHEAQLFVSYPPSLNYISHKAQTRQQNCAPFNKTLVICHLGNPFKRSVNASLSLRFDPKGIQDEEAKLEFVVFSNSTSHEAKAKPPLKLQANVVRQAELSLKGAVHPDHVFYGGEVKGESVLKYSNEIGSQVLHAYHVHNDGPWKVSSLEVRIRWPHQVANNKPQGKWLLYLDENPTVNSVKGGECKLVPGLVNPLGLPTLADPNEPPLQALTQPGGAPIAGGGEVGNGTLERGWRRRRDSEKIVTPEEFTKPDGRKGKTVVMDCKLHTAKCIEFKCIIYDLGIKQEAVINIRARLWNSTLVSDYAKVDEVRIVSRAEIVLAPGTHIEQSIADDKFHLTTIAYPDLLDQQESEPVPLWIIVVAVVAGLLLLVLLTLVLWKLGFFKRRRPDPTLSGNLEKSYRDSDS